jgi:hypothetical protein
MRIIVTHRGHGCDSGCCGHAIEIDGQEHDFYFEHPRTVSYRPYIPQSAQDFIRELVTEQLGEEHVKDIDFENCVVIDD